MTWEWLRKKHAREVRQIEDVWAMEDAREAKREGSKPEKKPARVRESEAARREARIAAKKQEAEVERAHERIQKTVQRPDPEPIENRKPQDALRKMAKTISFASQTMSYLATHPGRQIPCLPTPLDDLDRAAKVSISKKLRHFPGKFVAFSKAGDVVFASEDEDALRAQIVVEGYTGLIVLYSPKDSSEVP